MHKNFDIFLISCKFDIAFDNDFKTHKETGYCYNNHDVTKIKSYLLYWIEYYKLQGHSFCNIDKMIIKTIFDKCNMTYKEYMKQPMHAMERRLNFVIDRHRQLINALDGSKNHPLIRKYSHIRSQCFD